MIERKKRITSRAEAAAKKRRNKSSDNAKEKSFSRESRTSVREHIRKEEAERTKHFSEVLGEKERLLKLVREKKMFEALKLVRDSDHLEIDDMKKLVDHEQDFMRHEIDREGRGRPVIEEDNSDEDEGIDGYEEFSHLFSLYSEGGAAEVIKYAKSKNVTESVRKFLEAANEEDVIEENSEFFYGADDEQLVGLGSTTFAEAVNPDSEVGEFLSTLSDDFNVNEAIKVFSSVPNVPEREGEIDLSAEYFSPGDFEDTDIETQVLLELKQKNAQEAFSEYREVYKDKQKLKKIEREILDMHQSNIRSGRQREDVMNALNGIRSVIKNFDKKWDAGIDSNPELWYTKHILELRNYQRQLVEGQLAETPYVQEYADKVLDEARTGKPVFISGFHGGGKTMLAEKVARDLYAEVNPDEKDPPKITTISGNDYTTPADFLGQVVLKKPENIDDKKFDAVVEQADKWYERQITKVREAADKKLGELNEDDAEFKEVLRNLEEKENDLRQVKIAKIEDQLNRSVETIYEDGPIYEAMEEGKVLVIDEVNGIPHQTLISLNYILAGVKPGDKTTTPDGKQITVQPGFSIIMTGNLGEKYTDRAPIDPAFLDRLTKVDYDYLPQSIEGGPETASAEDELYHVFLSVFLDKYGNLRAPKGMREKLWNLAKTSRYLEDNFSGKAGSEIEIQAEGADKVPYTLDKHVPSLRVLIPVLQKCARENFAHSLEHYLYEDFIKKADDPQEDKDLIEQSFGVNNETYRLSDKDTLFREGWRDEDQPGEIEFVHKEEVAEYAFGRAPEHTYMKGRDVEAEKREQEQAETEREISTIDEVFNTLQVEMREAGCEM